MTDEKEDKFEAETQKERWVKYGSNVALTIIVVIVLAGLIVYLAQKGDRIFDTRASSSAALKPQTINLIKDLKSPVKIVSLYTAQRTGEVKTEKKARLERKQAVEDLLKDYKRYGNKVDIDFIDPDASPAKVDALIKDITTQYGGEVAKYQDFLDKKYPGERTKIKDLSEAEDKAVSALPIQSVSDEELQSTWFTMKVTVQELADRLKQQQEAIDRLEKQEPPDYKGATERVRSTLDDFGQLIDAVIKALGDVQASKAAPDAFKKYAAESTPRYQELKKESDAVIKQIDDLGDLKLDQLRQSLKQHDSILVLGPTDLRVIPFERVWVPDTQNQMKGFMKEGEAPQPAFAGEQAITTTIISLVRNSKPKVVFLRTGGAPLTSPGMPPFQRGGPLSDIADRLRDYNFDVMEKDLSGMYAMQAQAQGMPAEPEPTDDQIKDAVWVMLPIPQGQQQQQMPMPVEMAPKLTEHLKQGGAAMVLLLPDGDDLASATKDYGLEGSAKAIIVHEPIPDNGGAQGDQMEEARRLPYIFGLSDYGEHEITTPLRSLPSLFVPLMPVKSADAKDAKATLLLPIPKDPKPWAETDLEAAFSKREVKFEPDKGDLPPPLYAMGVSEKKDGTRLAVMGGGAFMTNAYLEELDPDVSRAQHRPVARFPANGDLFMNTVFWLSHEDTMIAISPAAMQVPRLADMRDATLNIWRFFLCGVLPALALAAGIGMYFSRRD